MNGIDWVKISQAIAAGIIPAPISSDENGMPIWQIGNKSITWQQIEEYIHLSNQPKTSAGPESIPAMPIGVDQYQMSEPKFEKPEQEIKPQVVTEPQTLTYPPLANTQSQSETPQPKGQVSIVGKTPVLTQVDITDPQSMQDYSAAHIKDQNTDSSKFLAEFLQKMLKILSATT